MSASVCDQVCASSRTSQPGRRSVLSWRAGSSIVSYSSPRLYVDLLVVVSNRVQRLQITHDEEVYVKAFSTHVPASVGDESPRRLQLVCRVLLYQRRVASLRYCLFDVPTIYRRYLRRQRWSKTDSLRRSFSTGGPSFTSIKQNGANCCVVDSAFQLKTDVLSSSEVAEVGERCLALAMRVVHFIR